MSVVLAYDQFNASTFTTGVFNAPAGTTLLRAKLTSYTFVYSQRNDAISDFAPPNTILGISWVPHGTAVPLITTANWKTSTWYIAGFGQLIVMDRWSFVDDTVGSSFNNLQHVYSNFIELEVPLFEANAFDLGISLNFLGGGFFAAASPWLTYQFEAYFD